MVQELDRWVVARALELLAERERAGRPVTLHVNLSGASLADVSVLEFIERRLDEGDADPSRCTFEITETARVHDYQAAAGFADRLTEFGCQVAIDDYGAGFGPFHYLKSDPLRPDQDRRRVRPRHAQQRRRPADRAGDRPDRPRPGQDDDRRVRPGRRHRASCCANTASTWPRATTWGARSTPPRRSPPSVAQAEAAVSVAGEGLEGVEVALQVLVGVGDRERPLLLGPRGHEDPVVHVVEPGEGRELIVDLAQVVAVLIQPLGARRSRSPWRRAPRCRRAGRGSR